MRNDSSPRRIRCEKGIYFRQLPGGRRRYEVTYLDSDRRRRWQVVDGGLMEARTALRKILARKDQGERVSPSRMAFTDFSRAWLDSQKENLRPRTWETYDSHLRNHLTPRLGRLRLQEIDADAAASLIADMRKAGKSAWTINGVLIVLGRVLSHAVRRGLIPANPLRQLERGERPSVRTRRDKRVLTHDEIRSLLDRALPTYRPLLATAIYTGARPQELLGLRWQDIEFDAGYVRVEAQADRKTKERVETKTPQGVRDIVLLPQLGKLLLEHKAASPYCNPSDPVFASREGRPLHWRNVASRGVGKAADRAGLNREGEPRVTMYTLRRTYASHLIVDLGLDAVQVSKQVGHRKVSITLDAYSDLFDRARHADEQRKAMAGSAFGRLLGGNPLETPPGTPRHSGTVEEGAEVVDMQVFRT